MRNGLRAALLLFVVCSASALAQMPPLTESFNSPPSEPATPKQEWLAKVYATIANAKPSAAAGPAGAADKGAAVVSFVVGPSGRIQSAIISRSSGDRRNDERALAMVRRADPVPPPPAQYGGRAVGLKFTARLDKPASKPTP